MSSDPPIPTLETARLTLRPWAEADAPDLTAKLGDAAAIRHWNAPPAASAEALADAIATSRAAPAGLHAAWSVVSRAEDRVMGMANYHDSDERNCRLGIGFALAPAYWGRGYAREAVSALLGHCFGALGAHRVEALVAPENAASLRLVNRLGFRCEGGPLRDRLHVGDRGWMNVMIYSLLKAEWPDCDPDHARSC